MRIIRTEEKPRDIVFRRLLARLGRGPLARRAADILTGDPTKAMHEVVHLAEDVITQASSNPEAAEDLRWTCVCLTHAADDDEVATSVHETIIESLIFVYDSRITAAVTRLFSRLLERRRTDYLPLLDRMLSSRLDTERSLAAATLVSLSYRHEDDAVRLLRVVRDTSPRVLVSASGALYRSYLIAGPTNDIRDAVLTIPPDVLASTAIPPISQSFSWFTWARHLQAWLEKRYREENDDSIATLLRIVKGRTRVMMLLWSLFLIGLLLVVRTMTGPSPGPSTDTILNIVTVGMAIAGICMAFLMYRLMRPYFRYRTLTPGARLLHLIESGEGSSISLDDVTATLNRDEPGQRRLVALAVDDYPGARPALSRLIATGTFKPLHLEDQAQLAGSLPDRRDRYVELIAYLSAVPGGRSLVQYVMERCWHNIHDSPQIHLLLDTDVPLVPPLLRLAIDRLRHGPLNNFRLLLRVSVEAPHVWLTWREPVIEGLGYAFREGFTFPDVVYHFLQLYPNDVYRALIRGHRYERRDSDLRRRFVEYLERQALSNPGGPPDAYRPVAHQATVERVKIAVIARMLDETPDQALPILFEVLGAGVDPHLMMSLPDQLRDPEVRAAAIAIRHLLMANDGETTRTLRAATAALNDLRGDDATALRKLFITLASVSEATTFEEIIECSLQLDDRELRRPSLLSSLRSVRPPLLTCIDLLEWALDCRGEVERSYCMLKAHGAILDLLATIHRRVPLPLRHPLVTVVEAIRRRVAAEVLLETDGPSPQDGLPSRTSMALRSTTVHPLPEVGPSYVGEATTLLRSFWDIVAPVEVRTNLGQSPTNASEALDELRAAVRSLERETWIDESGHWPSWTIPPNERDLARERLMSSLQILDSPLSPSHLRLLALRIVAPSRPYAIRRAALPIVSRWLADDNIRTTFEDDCAQSIIADDPATAHRIAVLHAWYLSLPTPLTDEIVDSFLRGPLRPDAIHCPEPETMAALGRLSLVDDKARDLLQHLDAHMDPLRLLHAHVEEALAGDTHSIDAVVRILRETGRSFADGPLIPSFILFTPARTLQRYREWLTALFRTIHRAGVAARKGSGAARHLLDVLEEEGQPKVHLAVLIERSIATVLHDPSHDSVELLAVFTGRLERQHDFAHCLLTALLRRIPDAWNVVEKLSEIGILSPRFVVTAVRDCPPRRIPGALEFIEEQLDDLVELDDFTILRHAYAFVDRLPACQRILRTIVARKPNLFLLPTQEAFWANLATIDPGGAWALLHFLENQRDYELPTRHLPGALSAIIEAMPEDHADESWCPQRQRLRLIDLCRRFGGDDLARLGWIAHHESSVIPILIEHLEDRGVRPEDRRGALIGLTRAAVRTETGRQLLIQRVGGGRSSPADRDVIAREIVSDTPRHPESSMNLLLDCDLLERLGSTGALVLAEVAAQCPHRSIKLFLSSWDHERALRIRHDPPDPITALRVHVLVLLERGRLEGPVTAFERVEATQKLLNESLEARGLEPPSTDDVTWQSLVTFLEFSRSVIQHRKPAHELPEAIPTDGTIAPATTTLSVLSHLTENAITSSDWTHRLAHLITAERTIQELLLAGLSRLPSPLAEVTEWAARSVATRLSDAESRPWEDRRITSSLLTHHQEMALIITNATGTPLRNPSVTITNQTHRTRTSVHEETFGDIPAGGQWIVRLSRPKASCHDDSDSLVVTLGGTPLPGHVFFAQPKEADLPCPKVMPIKRWGMSEDNGVPSPAQDFLGGEPLSRLNAVNLLHHLLTKSANLSTVDREEALVLTAHRAGWLAEIASFIVRNTTSGSWHERWRQSPPGWTAQLINHLPDEERRIAEMVAQMAESGHKVTRERIHAHATVRLRLPRSAVEAATEELIGRGIIVVEPDTTALGFPCILARALFSDRPNLREQPKRETPASRIIRFPTPPPP